MDVRAPDFNRPIFSDTAAVIDAPSIGIILAIMDILFVLIPLSVALALLILGALGWAVWRGQFESVDAEGERILRSD
jgi:cbb3-type cytochrome oxidase maturation protein